MSNVVSKITFASPLTVIYTNGGQFQRIGSLVGIVLRNWCQPCVPPDSIVRVQVWNDRGGSWYSLAMSVSINPVALASTYFYLNVSNRGVSVGSSSYLAIAYSNFTTKLCNSCTAEPTATVKTFPSVDTQLYAYHSTVDTFLPATSLAEHIEAVVNYYGELRISFQFRGSKIQDFKKRAYFLYELAASNQRSYDYGKVASADCKGSPQ